MRLLAPLLALLVLAAPAVTSVSPALWPGGPGHDHANPAHHGVGGGMVQLAQVKIRDGSVGEVDIQGNLAIIAHFGAGGLSVLDVANPAAPVLLGQYTHGTGGGMDAKWVPGTSLAILASQSGSCPTQGLGVVSLPGQKTGCGLNLLDLTNPAAPAFVAGVPCGQSGVHMFDVQRIHGVPFVFAVCQGQAYHVGVFAVEPVTKTIALVGALATDNPTSYVHDVTVRQDPLTGAYHAYLAAWSQGVLVYDVTAPAAPVLLGRWDSSSAPSIHTVMPVMVEGRRVIVASPELHNTVHVLDATDLGSIVKVGQWRNPDGLANNGFQFSTHDINVRDGKVYLGHYHGGVAVLGVRTLAEASNPPLLAWLLPGGAKYGSGNAPSTWDAVPMGNGYVLLGDMSMGFIVARETS